MPILCAHSNRSLHFAAKIHCERQSSAIRCSAARLKTSTSRLSWLATDSSALASRYPLNPGFIEGLTDDLYGIRAERSTVYELSSVHADLD